MCGGRSPENNNPMKAHPMLRDALASRPQNLPQSGEKRSKQQQRERERKKRKDKREREHEKK